MIVFMYIRQREPAKIVSKEWKLTIVFLRGLNVVSPDGNGRVGRLIMFKECLKYNIVPFIIDEGGLPFTNGDYIFIPEIAKAVKEKTSEVKAYVVNKEMKEFTLRLGELTDDERQIILDGCLINFYRNHQ